MRRRTIFVAAVAIVLTVCVSPSFATLGQSQPGGKVKVVIAGTNAKTDVTDGSLAGKGTFKASGAITDEGVALAYRTVKGDLAAEEFITLRFVTKGKKGAITYVVRIDTTRRPVVSRWKIESSSRAYKGLRGQGIETENATYTVSTLRGKVWR